MLKKVKQIKYILIILLVITSIFLVYKIITINKNTQNKTITNNFYLENKTNLALLNNIKKDEVFNFSKKINDLIKKKYPYFIFDEINKTRIIWKYYFLNDYLFIDFLNNDYNLKINYNHINTYLIKKVDKRSYFKDESGFDIDMTKKHVAFTFDDGPHSSVTLKIIETLKNNFASATFFVIGVNINNNESVLRELSKTNNEIGVHGFSHKNFLKLSTSEVEQEIKKTKDLIYNITGRGVDLVRPPYGEMKKSVAKNYNEKFILWNVDSNDWNKSEEYIKTHIINEVKDGDIVLFHDTYLKTNNALEVILKELYLRNFQVVSVSTLAKIKNKTIDEGEIIYYIK